VQLEAAVEIEAAPTWASESKYEAQTDWRSVDRALRTIAGRRAALDADEARWLREAEAIQIWRPLGMVSALDYMERVLGYGPRVAQDRLRVARALGTLPQLTAALAHGELPFSAIRELTRVATPATEAAWRQAATGKNLRQIEELVADHRPGDCPDDPPDPEVRVRVVRFELSAETFALMRQARVALDDEHGSHLSDDEFIAALSNAVLDGTPTTETTGRAKFQIAVTVCERCRQGWQDGAGTKIAIGPAAVERAVCDAQHIGSIDGATPERAHQDVPPSVARLVWRRDGGRCRVPGCRSARGIEIHHLVHRTDGGSHDASNLALLCSACHLAHHRGVLTITGTADHLEVRRSAEPSSIATAGAHVGAAIHRNAHVGAVANRNAYVGAPTKLDAAILGTQAKEALVGLGWKPAIAQAASAAASAALGTGATLERLIFEALRRCPKPNS
jgi:HNH endonuclease/RuvA, C-terminal domain